MPKGVYLRTEEHKRNIGKAHKDKKISEEQKRFLSEINSGENHPQYIDGRTNKKYYCLDCGKELSYYTAKRCKPCSKKGEMNPSKKPRTKKKMSIAAIERCKNPEYRKVLKKRMEKLNKNPEFNKRRSAGAEKRMGDNHHNWQGGKSFEPYSIEFNESLKELIRKRDNRVCQLCNKDEKENGRKLSVHHINRIKKDCDVENLISLCRSCHMQLHNDMGIS